MFGATGVWGWWRSGTPAGARLTAPASLEQPQVDIADSILYSFPYPTANTHNPVSLPSPRYQRSMTASATREFNQADADAVYNLARQPSTLGKQTKHGLDVIEQALDRYGSV